MELTLEYNKAWTPQGVVSINDIADFAIEASNDDGEFYYLLVKTCLGNSLIATCGPVIPDVNMIVGGYSCSIIKIEYSEDKITKFLNKWVNDKYRKITKVELIKEEDAISQFKDVQAYLANLDEGAF